MDICSICGRTSEQLREMANNLSTLTYKAWGISGVQYLIYLGSIFEKWPNRRESRSGPGRSGRAWGAQILSCNWRIAGSQDSLKQYLFVGWAGNGTWALTEVSCRCRRRTCVLISYLPLFVTDIVDISTFFCLSLSLSLSLSLYIYICIWSLDIKWCYAYV